jgi:hypothetical protein
LTHLANPNGALQALSAASRAEVGDPAQSAASTIVPPKLHRIEARQGAAVASPRAVALLGRLVSQLPADSYLPHSIQFLPCCAAERAGSIANTVACASSVLLGRTLLLDARANDRTALSADLHPESVPDAFTPGLYHCQIGSARTRGFPFSLLTLQSAVAGPYRLIVLDSPAPEIGGVALTLAPLCGGTVLVVLAGITRLAAVRSAAAELTSAGARLLGTILLATPSNTTRSAQA